MKKKKIRHGDFWKNLDRLKDYSKVKWSMIRLEGRRVKAFRVDDNYVFLFVSLVDHDSMGKVPVGSTIKLSKEAVTAMYRLVNSEMRNHSISDLYDLKGKEGDK